MLDNISGWIKKQVRQAGKTGVVLGLSGGIDSALAAFLAVRGLGKEQVFGIYLPCESNPRDIADARLVEQKLGIKTFLSDLTDVYRELIQLYPKAPKSVNINLKPRLRMITLYHHAGLHDCLVLGTGNKSELRLGYFTKYGDGGVDLLPLGDLYKHEVTTLARQIGVPQPIINKPPSAGLHDGQTDEGEIGLSYGEIDHILECLEKGIPCESSQDNIDKVKLLVKASEHKRDCLPTFYKDKQAEMEIVISPDLKILPQRYQVIYREEPVEMTLKEYELFKFLSSHPGKVFTREQLLKAVWGDDFWGGARTVDVHIRRLRSKLEGAGDTFIETIHSVGYAFRKI